MSENPDRHDDDEELESLLRQLVPTPLDAGRPAELLRHANEEMAADRDRRPAPLHWGRVIPFVLVCTMASFGFALFRYGERLRTASTPTALVETASHPDRMTAHASPGESADSRLLPVSSHGIVVNASSDGVVETEEGPRERLRIDYGDAYHWHDPESGTNVRFFQPRSEEVDVPLRTH